MKFKIHRQSLGLVSLLISQIPTVISENTACIDNDAAIVEKAVENDLNNISGCIDIADACTRTDEIGTFVRANCCETCEGAVCIDNDAAIVQKAQEKNIDDISGCIDAAYACTLADNIGAFVRANCCDTCGDPNSNVPENSLPPSDETVDLYLLGGQSECTGGASVETLEADSENYPELQDEIDGVWFAGFKAPSTKDRFFLTPMKAGEARSGERFGPEVSFGERMQAITGKRVIVVKYCEGGSNVHTQWNPDTTENNWSKEDDNGYASFLYDSVDFSSKAYLFKNMVYTMRMTEETLIAGGVDYRWAGIVWVQGQADRDEGNPVWKTFGENTARVWNGLINEIGAPVPIIDTGGGFNNQLTSGKKYATQLVEGCMAHNVQPGAGAIDDTISTCIPSPTDSCIGTEGLFINSDIYNFYGYDPLYPEEYKPEGATNKVFRWYKNFGVNNHSEDEGMVLKGRMLANAFVKEFLSDEYDLPSEYGDVDIAIKFPHLKCEGNTFATANNMCWHDYRDVEISGSGCPYQPQDDDAICVDDNDALVKAAVSSGYNNINSCGDVSASCGNNNKTGRFVQATCCQTCSESEVRRRRKHVRGGRTLQLIL